MYLCIYVSMYLCIYVSMYLCMCVRMLHTPQRAARAAKRTPRAKQRSDFIIHRDVPYRGPLI